MEHPDKSGVQLSVGAGMMIEHQKQVRIAKKYSIVRKNF